MKLTIELVPKSSWYTNVRSNVSKERWDELRFECYRKAKYKCEICGETGKKQGYEHDVECHEIWEYNDEKKIQRLAGLIALCPKCHKVKHIGLSMLNNEYESSVKHLRKVNKWSKRKTENYVDDCFNTWNERSQYNWTLDITYLSHYQDQLGDLLSKLDKFRKK
jgi:5-methylcytosine-specific restriction endonuclease McrA